IRMKPIFTVGVHPEFRKQKIGQELYNRFFRVATQNGRNIVRCVTSHVKKASIVYHRNMGFEIEDGDTKIDGVSVSSNYDGPSQDRVLFVKHLLPPPNCIS